VILAFAAIMTHATALHIQGVACEACADIAGRGDLVLRINGTRQQAQALRLALWQDFASGSWRVHVLHEECGPG